MNKKHARFSPARSVCLASAAALLVSLAATANAQSTEYDVNGTSAQLGPAAVTTAPYPIGDSQLYVPSPYVTTLSPMTATPVTFTATTGIRFESFTNTPDSTGTTPLDFAPGTQLLDTFDPDAVNPNPNIKGTPTGPLRIDFGSGVSAFGLSVQDGQPDFEMFTFAAYDGSTLLSTTPFTTGLYDNSLDTVSGKSLFLGAQATGGAVITSVLISSTSLAPDPNTGELVDSGYSNDFFFGPLSTVPAAVPEASTTVSFGLLLTLGVGGALLRRKITAPKAAGD